MMEKQNHGFRKRFILPAIGMLCIAFLAAGNFDTHQAKAAEVSEELPPIPDDVTGGDPWIDSCVAGNVTADTQVSPAEDFYLNANKDWIASNQLPEGSPTLDADVFAEEKEHVLKALAGDPLSDHDARQGQLLYAAFVDTDARDAAGCEPAKRSLTISVLYPVLKR